MPKSYISLEELLERFETALDGGCSKTRQFSIVSVALPDCFAESFGEFLYCAEIVKSTWLVSPVRTVTFLAQVFGSL